MTAFTSALYTGKVLHQRTRPRRHRLSYRVFYGLFDLDELPVLDNRLKWFSHNRRNLFSFFDRDHGPGLDAPLRGWIEAQLRAGGIDPAGGPIRVLCMPRVLGYVFNPLSVYFCYRPSGEPTAVLYEVNNTFGQQHSYLIPAGTAERGILRHSCRKRLYVSPFIDMGMVYNFRIRPPDERVSVIINETDGEGLLLHASLEATRHPLGDRALLGAFLRSPLMTLKVIAGIHWEALHLWRKRIPLVKRPAPPKDSITIVHSNGS